jgi:hypothetical protein
MGSTCDLGSRVELVSMDPHCFNITIALYDQSNGSGPRYLVHSYSSLPAARARLDAVKRAMQVLAALEARDGSLAFSCGDKHQLAMRRAFLEACKLSSEAPAGVRPMSVPDKKLEAAATVRSLGNGLYELTTEKNGPDAAARLEAIVNGYRKLAEVEAVPGQPKQFRFSCGQPHDELVGLLLPRALNVRAILREQEMAAGRGTLVAPSAQK